MRRRLLTVAVASAAIVVVAFALPLAALVRDVARDRAISAAERDAAALAPVLAVSTSPEVISGAIERTETGADGRIAVWLPDGSRVGDPTSAADDIIDLVRAEQQSFSRSVGGGIETYAPVITGAGDVSVTRTRVPEGLLEKGVSTAWLALAIVGVVLLAASAFVADRLARSLTRDADELKATADRLAGGAADARAPRFDTAELDAAGSALNALAERIDELRAAERERVADLSHRLRTPLTALRLDAERVADPALVDGVDRLEGAVTELIRTARRPLGDSAVPARCDAGAVVRERAEFWSALAVDDARPWSVDVPTVPVPVALGVDDLAAALDVVLGNVFAHTEPGTAYAVALRVADGTASLSVDDAGTGFSADAAARGASGAGSSGLGLSIAEGAALAAGGDLIIERSAMGGARVVMRMPERRSDRGT